MSPADATPSPAAALLYDAGCGFCRWCAAGVLALDRRRRLRPVTIQSPEGQVLLGGMREPERMGSWHLVTPDGRRSSAGAAVAPLLRLLPGGRVPAALADRAPRTVERLYRAVARRRGTFGRLVGARARARADRRIAARAGSR